MGSGNSRHQLDPRIQADFAVTNGTIQGVTFEALRGKAEYEGRPHTST
jgi:hypothetical protein